MIASSATSAEGGAFDPDPQAVAGWIDAVRRYITAFVDGLDDAPAIGPVLPVDMAGRFAVPPPDEPGRFEVLLDTFAEAARYATETAGPRHFAYVPGGGLVSSAIAELLASVVNHASPTCQERRRPWRRFSTRSKSNSKSCWKRCRVATTT